MFFSYMLFHFTYTDIPQPTGGTLTFKDVFRCISKFSICLNSSSHKPYSKFCFCMLPHEPRLNQCSARPLILFKTKTKTCLDFNFLSRPIPRLVLISIFFQDQYQDKSWNGYFFETNTKTSLDIGNNSRPIPRVLIVDIFESNTNSNTNTVKFNPIDVEDHKGEFLWDIL